MGQINMKSLPLILIINIVSSSAVLANAQQPIDLKYEIVIPPDFKSGSKVIDGSKIELVKMSLSGDFVLCKADGFPALVWNLKSNIIKNCQLGHLKNDQLVQGWICDNGTVVFQDRKLTFYQLRPEQDPSVLFQLKKFQVENTLVEANTFGNLFSVMAYHYVTAAAHKDVAFVVNLADRKPIEIDIDAEETKHSWNVTGINNKRLMVGRDGRSAIAAENGEKPAAVVSIEHAKTLGLPGRYNSADFIDVNDDGVAIGRFSGGQNNPHFVWSKKSGVKLFEFDNWESSFVELGYINNNGLVIGKVVRGSPRFTTAIWDVNQMKKGIVKLDDIVTNRPEGLSFFTAVRLANNNNILGYGVSGQAQFTTQKLYLLCPLQ